MKKNLLILIAFIFSLTIKAQSPALTYTNVTGSNSITCSHPSINYIASVSNYTNGPLTYTWVSLVGTASGTNVTFSNPAQYTLTAFDVANSFSLSQVFSVGINTTIPTSTVTPLTNSISCTSTAATFTGIVTSSLTNISHSWYSPFSTQPAVNGGTISIYNYNLTSVNSNLAPGTYTYCVTDNINGCSTCKTVTVTSASSFPTFSITSPQFTLGCGSTSITSINIVNPTPSVSVSFTVLPPSFFDPTYSLGSSQSYSANVPGTYYVIMQNNLTNCETKIPISIISNTVGPNISYSSPTNTLSCNTSSILLTGLTTNTNVSYTWSYPGPGQVTTNTVAVLTTSNTTNTVIATYSLSITDNANMCSSTQTVTLYQNTAKPTAFITGSNVISCPTPSIILTNSSISNIPPAFPHTQPVVATAWYGPVPQASLANSPSYIAYTPANATNPYTLTVQDLNNGCTAIATKTIGDNRIYPIVNTTPPFNINCPVTTATIYPNVSGPYTYSWTAPATVSISSNLQATITVNAPGDYTIAVTNPANGCVTTSVITVAVCAGIKQNAAVNNDILIFPNPNNGVFTIEVTDLKENTTIEVYSALGILVKKQAVIIEKNELNIEKEAGGLYFIRVSEDEKVIKTAKIVKQ